MLSTCLFLTDLIEIFDLYFILMHTKDLTIFPGESLVFRFYCGLVNSCQHHVFVILDCYSQVLLESKRG